MPLRSGFSRDIVGSNMSELLRAGKPRKQAVKIALDNARKNFRRRNPGKALPRHLKGGATKK